MRQATYVDGLWNGRPVGEWIPEIVDDVVEGLGLLKVRLTVGVSDHAAST